MRPDLALAEAPRTEELAPSRPHLHLVPNLIDQAPAETSQGLLINADHIPELSAERQRAAQEAARILGQNRHLLTTSAAEVVPTSVNALGTAQQVVETKRQFGENSPEYQEMFTGLVLDSERLLAEAYSKNTSEYFGKILQNFDAPSGEYFSHGLSISRMVKNGLSPSAEPEEQGRRLNENVEETGTYEPIGRTIGSIGLQGMIDRLQPTLVDRASEIAQDFRGTSIDVTTISECTDYALRDYKIDPKASHGGYAPAVEKFMIRRVHFSDDSGDRLEEQVAVPGKFITSDIIRGVLAEKDSQSELEGMDKTDLHGTQFVGIDSGEVIYLIKELDERASAEHGKNIFMGEEVPADHPKDYGEFMEDAEIRRQKLAPKPTELAEYLITLEENGANSRVAETLVDKFLKKTLLEVAKNHPELAEAMFDKETAKGFEEVARLKALGKDSEANSLQIEVEKNAPEASYCGAGGCGTEALDGAAAQRARTLGLTGNDLMLNVEHACTNCSEMQLCHDEKGNTVCLACESTKLNGQSVKTSPKSSQKH
jgi:hypothetical protein